MSDANKRYAEYPDHPLHNVPEEILTTARNAMNSMEDALYDKDDAIPVADAMVINLLPWLSWEAKDTSNE